MGIMARNKKSKAFLTELSELMKKHKAQIQLDVEQSWGNLEDITLRVNIRETSEDSNERYSECGMYLHKESILGDGFGLEYSDVDAVLKEIEDYRYD